MSTKEELIKQAELVRNAKIVGENTAHRVGSLLLDIVNMLGTLAAPTIPDMSGYLTRSEFDEMFAWTTQGTQRFIDTKASLAVRGDLATHYAGEPLDIPTYVTSEALEARLKELNVGVGGLDMDALQSYLTENSYATQDWVLSQGFLTGVTGFLPLSGGTLSDALTIQCGADTKLAFNNTDGEKYSAIKFLENSVEYSRMIGWEHKFEFSKYLEAPKFVAQTTNLCQNVNADLLDGRHANYFVTNNQDLLGNNVNFNTVNYSRHTGITIQAIHVPNYTGQTNTPGNAYGQMLTFGGYSGYFPFRLAYLQNSRLYLQGGGYRTEEPYNFNHSNCTEWKPIAFTTDNVAQATEMYNATYGGGWYMKDSTYIRNRGNKRVQIEGIDDYYAIWLNRGGYCCEGHPGFAWNNGYGALNVGVANNGNQTNLLIAYRNESGLLGSARLFAMEFLNTGTLLRFCFGGSNKYDFNSDGTLVAAGDLVSHSDERLKSDIRTLDFRGALTPRTYIKDGKRCIGFVAQEVEPLYPETVLKGELWSVNYGALTAVLASQNNAQQKQLNSHEDRLSVIERKLNIAQLCQTVMAK